MKPAAPQLSMHSPLCVTVPEFEFPLIDESTVTDLLKKVDVRKATGCHKIQARAPKLSAETIARSSSSLFNLGLKMTTQVPLE